MNGEYLKLETIEKLTRLEKLEKYLDMVLLTAKSNGSVKIDIAYIENMKQILDGSYDWNKVKRR